MSTTPATLSTTIASGGTAPTGMRASSAQAAVDTDAAFSTASNFGFTTTQADAIVTLINELRAACMAAGIIKGSA